jgi:class 3 adenylate cyclase/ABC-type branched-subunit amino acid transport system substrate-binding protein
MSDDRQPANQPRTVGGTTRGFLFADLRGYTAYVDRNGPEAAAHLLERYRALVRAAVTEHDGAEIRTEGDSFYVVFPSVSAALRCALSIVERAAPPEEGGGEPIRVGVGIHAGETVDTSEGYVGQPVNIAARLCALAAAGEVLVSDTVRSLAQAVVTATFVSLGRRRLKGIAEPLAIYSVIAGRSSESRPRWLRRSFVVAGIVIVLAVAGIGVGGMWLSRAQASLTGIWTIGFSSVALPDGSSPFRDAVELALSDARAAGRLSTFNVDVRAVDEGDGSDLALNASNAAQFVADPNVVAMISAGTSVMAEQQIPITDEAGLLDCSPTTTDAKLTKPRDGALDLRTAHPTQINYVRLPATNDVEAGADASFARNDLDAAVALVVDDTRPVGGLVAVAFQREFEALGGCVIRRALNPGANAADLLRSASASGAPDLVYFGGFTDGGAAELRQAMFEVDQSDTPFLGWDGLWDGPGTTPESFVARAGDAAVGSYVSHPTVGTISADFERSYRDAFGDPPSGALYDYTAAAYACAQIIVASLDSVHGTTDPRLVREAVRSYAVDPRSRFQTVLGEISFDTNGDSLRQIVSFYRADPNAAGGVGDWVLVKQQDFGPAR